MGVLEKFNKSLQDPFMPVHSHKKPHPKSWNYRPSPLKRKNVRMACKFQTRKAMFIFQRTAPWRCDCHPGLKSRQKARRGTGPQRLNTQHQASVSSGEGTLLLSSWYIPECHGFPYPNTSWHWRLHRSQSSGVRPGTCIRPEQLTATGAGRGSVENHYQRAMTCHGRLKRARGSKDYGSNPFFIERSFSKCLT